MHTQLLPPTGLYVQYISYKYSTLLYILQHAEGEEGEEGGEKGGGMGAAWARHGHGMAWHGMAFTLQPARSRTVFLFYFIFYFIFSV